MCYEQEDPAKYYRAGFNGFYRGERNTTGQGRGAFHLNYNWAKRRTVVDKLTTGQKLISIFGKHASEDGWSLPIQHRRHLLQLPIDILTRIMSFCLVANAQITPNVVSCNCLFAGEFQEPSYTISGTRAYRRQTELCEIQGVDRCHKAKYGNKKYVTKEYSGYFRKPIDATLLRVCKLFCQEGLPLLYGDNEYVFDLDEGEYRKTRNHVHMNPGWERVSRPRAMPQFRCLDDEDIQYSIRNMVNIKDPEELDHWIYCDPFARFLHHIGPKNASFIRKLRIVGGLFPEEEREYRASTGYRSEKAFSLRYYLTAYAPFILRYCHNLVKLGIGFTYFQEKLWNVDPETGIGEKLMPIGMPVDPEDENVQLGDALLEEGYLEIIRNLRSDNRERKCKMQREEYEKGLALTLKPFIDDFVPKLKKLQVLEVKRQPIKHDPYSGIRAIWEGYGEYIPWVDMEMANEAKHALSIAVYKRSLEMEAAKKMASLAITTTTSTAIIPSNSWSADIRGRGRWHGRRGAASPGGTREGYRGRGNWGNISKWAPSSASGREGTRGGYFAPPETTSTALDLMGPTFEGAPTEQGSHSPSYRGRANRGRETFGGYWGRDRRGDAAGGI